MKSSNSRIAKWPRNNCNGNEIAMAQAKSFKVNPDGFAHVFRATTRATTLVASHAVSVATTTPIATPGFNRGDVATSGNRHPMYWDTVNAHAIIIVTRKYTLINMRTEFLTHRSRPLASTHVCTYPASPWDQPLQKMLASIGSLVCIVVGHF